MFTLLSVEAKSNVIYADIQVTNLEPTQNFIWTRENQNTPAYPIGLARPGLQGCAILSFDISDSGNIENIEVLHAIPNNKLGKHSLKMIKKWKWIPTTAEATSEQRIIRLDFCLGGESLEEAQNICKKRTELACG